MDWDNEGPGCSELLFFGFLMLSLIVGAFVSLIGLICYYLLPVLLIIDLIIRIKEVYNKTNDKNETIKVGVAAAVELILTWLVCSRMFGEVAFPGAESGGDSIFMGIGVVFVGLAVTLAVTIGYLYPRIYLLLNHDYEPKYCLYTSLVCSMVSILYYAIFYA